MTRSKVPLLLLLFILNSMQALHFHGNATFLDEATLIAPISFHNTLLTFNRTQLNEEIDVVFSSVAKARQTAFTYIDNIYSQEKEDNPEEKKKKQESIFKLKKEITDLLQAEIATIVHLQNQIQAFFARYASGLSRRQAPWEIFAGIFSIGSSIYSLHQVHQVNNDIEIVRSEQISEAREMVELKTGLLSLAKHLKRKEVFEQIYKNIVPKIRATSIYLGNIVNGLHDAVKLEINTDLFDEHTLVKQIVEDAKGLGYYPISEGIDLLYKSFLTSEVDSEALYVTIHVPIVRYLESILTLKRILPIYAVDENLTFLKFAPKHEYIAVSRDRLAHIPVTADELLSCVHKDRYFFCPDMTILYRKSQSCAAALYYNDITAYLEMCDFIFTKTPEEVSRVGLHEYLVKDLGNDVRARRYCTNDLTPKNVRDSVAIYTLDKECRLEHPDYLIIPEKDINRHEQYHVNLNVSMKMLNLSIYDYSQILETLETQREIPHTLKQSATNTAINVLIIVVTVLAIILVMVIGGMCVLFKKFGHFFFGPEDVSIHESDEQHERHEKSEPRHVVEKVATAAQLAAAVL